MKKIFLVTIMIFQTFHFAGAVENSVSDVENKYQHQIICKAWSQNQEFDFLVQWKKKVTETGRAPSIYEKFKYQLIKSASGENWSAEYTDGFQAYVSIQELTTGLLLKSELQISTRLGIRYQLKQFQLEKENGQYFLMQMKSESVTDFMTEVHKIIHAKEFLFFEKSSCQYSELY